MFFITISWLGIILMYNTDAIFFLKGIGFALRIKPNFKRLESVKPLFIRYHKSTSFSEKYVIFEARPFPNGRWFESQKNCFGHSGPSFTSTYFNQGAEIIVISLEFH